MPTLSERDKNPVKVVGPSLVDGFFGRQKLVFVGNTGLVGTTYGIPGVTATRVSTGLYRLRHDPVRSLTVIPQIQGVSGTYYQINVQNVFPTSGTLEVAVSRAAAPFTPVSGTTAELLFLAGPLQNF